MQKIQSAISELVVVSTSVSALLKTKRRKTTVALQEVNVPKWSNFSSLCAFLSRRRFSATFYDSERAAIVRLLAACRAGGKQFHLLSKEPLSLVTNAVVKS